MSEYKNEFKRAYEGGRAATHNDIEHLKETGELTHDLSYSILFLTGRDDESKIAMSQVQPLA
jgi:hypothetical protein